MGEMAPGLLAGFGMIGPELVLVAAACALFIADCFTGRDQEAPRDAAAKDIWALWSIAAIAVAIAVWAPQLSLPSRNLYSSFLKHDALAWYVKGAAMIGGAVFVLLSWNQIRERQAGEYYGCLLMLIVGLNLIGMANDLVGLFLALELVSIPTYVLLFLSKSDGPGQEATLKYFLLSIFSSAILLYGLSFLYGAAGSTNIEAIRACLLGREATSMPQLLLLATLLILAGLAFRITAVPFHFYAPDVFSGTSPAMAGLLSYAPKVAGFAALFRLIAGVMLVPTPDNVDVVGLPSAELAATVGILAAATMFIGNVLAFVQTDLRRLFAYSAVAHGGYMLVGLAIGQPRPHEVTGAQAVLFYLAAYGAMTLGAFSVLVALDRPDRPIRTIDDVKGMFRTHPFLAVAMSVFLFSLIGLPPTGGFVGKLQLMLALVSRQSTTFILLACILALNAAIGAYYYLRVVIALFSSPVGAPIGAGRDRPGTAAAVVCLVLTVGLFFAPNLLLQVLQDV